MADGVHPEIAVLLAAEDASAAPADLAARRAAYVRVGRDRGGEPAALAGTQELVIPVAYGGLPARLYRPAGEGGGLVVFLHGGGWVLGDLDSHDLVARALAAGGGHAVLSVDYRLAPEHRFPAARDDTVAAVAWARGPGAGAYGWDPARVMVAGDSAGGQLAVLAALAARGDGLAPLRHQLLVYPALDPWAQGDAHATFAHGPGLTVGDMLWYWREMLGDADPAELAPLRWDLTGAPAASIALAAIDPLRDDGLRYAELLRAAGVEAQVRVDAGMVHGYLRWAGVVGGGRALLAWAGARIAAAL